MTTEAMNPPIEESAPRKTAVVARRPRFALGLILVPVAAGIALAVDLLVPNQQNPETKHHYPQILVGMIAAAVFAAIAQMILPARGGLRKWIADQGALLCGA